MKQVLQSYKTGKLTVADVPAPGVEDGSVLVQTTVSLVSVGTEKMTIDLAKKSLLGKARQRPDLVRKLLTKAAREGVVSAVTAAQRKLDQPIPLGYSCVGRVLAVGRGVSHVSVGQRVACAGAKVANHAEINLVPKNLCVAVPEAVSDDAAAFVTLGAIALQGLRQAAPTMGENFAVIGLGLIGQLTVQLLRAQGCRVLGIDLDPAKVALAADLGAEATATRGRNVHAAADALSAGRGIDGVIIAAATPSSDPIDLAGALCRDRGRVVALGAVGMNVPRRPYYDKELTLLQSRSYGPGRYDPVYEDAGIDYPIGYVRWTEQRNMEAFLDQCRAGRIDVRPLVSGRFAIENALEAYALLGQPGAAPLGLLLDYPSAPNTNRALTVGREVRTRIRGDLRLGFVGAGNFATGTLIPALANIDRVARVGVCSNRGFSAQHVAEQFGFATCTTDVEDLLRQKLDAVVIATRHNLHASQTIEALAAGCHVFVEKPLALTEDELTDVLAAQRRTKRILMVGYNRRFSPLATTLHAFMAGAGPLVMNYRVNAGMLPADSWIHDPEIGGGRIIGEGCHFIDFLSFVCGAPPIRVFTQGTPAAAGVRPEENLIINLSFADGSVGVVTYAATGDPAAGKERFEVLGGGRSAVLDDFRLLDLQRGGKQQIVRKLTPDKGHRAELVAFTRAARLGGPGPIDLEHIAAISRATFAAVQSLRSGKPVVLASGRLESRRRPAKRS